MSQQEKYDNLIKEYLTSSKYEVSPQTGEVFSVASNGNKRKIGCETIYGDIRFTTWDKDRNRFSYPICRAVYLYENLNKDIKKYEVFNIDGDRKNNKIKNLDIRKFDEKTHRLAWSEKDKIFLLSNYKDMSYENLSNELGRGVQAIRKKLKKLKAPKKVDKRRKWTEDDDNTLRNLYLDPKVPMDRIAKIMNRSLRTIQLRASKLKLFRETKTLQLVLNKSSFYQAFKNARQNGTLGSRCCLCGYSKHIDLHHLDGDRKNNNVYNIASVCPNCHREVESGDHQGKTLYCVWWRIYPQSKIKSKEVNNIKGDEKWFGLEE